MSSPAPFTLAELATLRQAAEREQVATDLTCRFCHDTPVRSPGDACGTCVDELLTVASNLDQARHEPAGDAPGSRCNAACGYCGRCGGQ